MNIPVEVSYRGVEKTEQLEELITEQKAKLDKFSDRINSCRVSVELDQNSRHTANVYRVRLDLTINHGHEIPVVEKTKPDDEHPGVEPLIRKAFDTARRQVIKIKERQKREIKSHPDQAVQGIVKHVFPEQGYGIIQSMEGEDIYFHENSVAGNKFDHISLGTGVSYSLETGEKGLQATVVHIQNKPSL
jgi:cold shock CspA family protein/ribosome-associated translation inhibitor RaiA